HVGEKKNDYLSLLKRKRTSKWDENFKPCKKFLKLDVKNLSRRSRWGADYEKTFTPVPMANIPPEIDPDQFEILIRKYRLEDISRRLNTNDWENADPDLRSPSPDPVYDSRSGKR